MERERAKERFAGICRAVAWVCLVACAICVLIRDRFERDADALRTSDASIHTSLLEFARLESNHARLVDEMARVSTQNPRLRAFMVGVGFEGLPPPAPVGTPP